MPTKFEMSVPERRELLERMDILVKRPATGDERTLGEALVLLNKLFSSLCQEQIEIQLVTKGK